MKKCLDRKAILTYGTSLSLEQQYSRQQSSVWLLISSRINAQNTVLLFCLQLTSVMLFLIILIWKQAQGLPSYLLDDSHCSWQGGSSDIICRLPRQIFQTLLYFHPVFRTVSSQKRGLLFPECFKLLENSWRCKINIAISLKM